jgi:hypothetical protein
VNPSALSQRRMMEESRWHVFSTADATSVCSASKSCEVDILRCVLVEVTIMMKSLTIWAIGP